MPDLQGTKTEKNLLAAFAGESQARNKYTYFASVAKKEGYEQIAIIFLETAEQEKEHAKLHLKALKGIGDTVANLKAAAAGEDEEHTDMYPRMAAEADEEGFEAIAILFRGIALIERDHQERFEKLLSNIETGTVFARQEQMKWRCRNCGFTLEAQEPFEMCPVCRHPKAYFELAPTNF